MRPSLSLITLILAAGPALAGENADLDLIPEGVTQDAPTQTTPSAAPREYTLSVTEAASFSSMRADQVVPIPGRSSPNWENRVSLDGRITHQATDRLKLTLSDRLSFTGDDRRGFPNRRNFRNDLREAYATAEPVSQTYLEAGRINIKNGAATGYNPTDFFKTGTQVDQSSSDPSALRENRLGTAMVRAQTLWTGGSASLLYAPKLAAHPTLGETAPTLDPQFDKTNNTNRWLATLDLEIANVSTQYLLFQEGNRTRFGFNASTTVSNSVIGYVEWAGGRDLDLANAAFSYGRATGTFPAPAPQLLSPGGAERFQNDLAIGGSWTSESKVTINAEYHFHQAGLNGNQWKNWYDTGTNGGLAAGEMWQMRSYAVFRQDPAARHRLFIRVAWNDAIVQHLDLTGFSLVDFGDGSATSQITASYPVSDTWSVSALVSANTGKRRSEFGSLPEAAKGILQLVRYF